MIKLFSKRASKLKILEMFMNVGPMIRVLGGNPMEVVDKVIRVAKAAGWLSDKDPQNTSAS
jgi:hypothetical protein